MTYDRTAELNAYFAEPTDSYALDRDSEYECASTVHLPAGDLNLNGATILRPSRQFGRARIQCLLKNESSHVFNGHIIGNKRPENGYQVATEGTHAFGVVGCVNCTFEGLTIEHCPGDAFWITSFGKRPQVVSRNITVRNVAADDIGRHPFSALAVDGLAIYESEFMNWFGAARIDTEKAGKFKSRNIHDDPSNDWVHRTAA